MTCDAARATLSAAMDGEASPGDAVAAREHLADCAECRAHVEAWERVRGGLAAGDHEPDLTAAVLARITARPKRRVPPLVAAAVAGILVGATLVSTRPGSGPELVGADIPRRVLAAQTRIDSLRARMEITERGWHPSVPVRRYAGSLQYVAPETVAVHLDDQTRYPSDRWVANDVDIVVDRAGWWARGPAPCPTEAQPGCTPATPRVRVVTGREPFAEDLPAPLDLVLPASGFAVGDNATVLADQRRFDGRAATGVVTTAAQIAALLDFLRLAGNWRPIPPTAAATLWLDTETLVPVLVDVGEASAGPALQIRLRRVTPAGPFDADPAPAAPVVRDAGFRDGGAASPTPTWLPPGMQPYRSGATGAVSASSWSDGRAWIKVRSTTTWPGGRLFGGLGDVQRTVPLPGAGVAYVAEGGRKVALHGAGIDVVLTGSVTSAELVRVAGSLGVRGDAVPGDWAEASTATLATARAVLVPLLELRGSRDFAPPSVRVEGQSVTLAYAGAGDRGFALVQQPGTTLAPPLDADVTGVRVRGRVARWTPDAHTLEWVEAGHVVELRSRTLRLAELVEVATDLRVAR